MPLKSIASMPAMAGPSFRPLKAQDSSSLKRSQSMAVNKPHERMRLIARHVPFMAFPGVGSQLTTFARSYSRANLQRLSMGMGSRKESNANLSGYGTLQTPSAGHDALVLTSPPSFTYDRDNTEVSSLFGTVFNEEDDLEMMQPGWTSSLILAVFTSVLASFQVGYNSGVLNVPQDVIVAALNLSTIEWSIAVAIFCIGGLIGSLSGGRIADRIGRKNFLIANNAAFVGGGLLEALASSFFHLSAGRLLIGIGCGGATVVVPMYLGEIAPANLRGSLGTMNQFSMVVGILIANLVGKPLGTPEEWRYLLGLCLIPALLQMAMSSTLLESPLWLVLQGGAHYRMQAEEILLKLRDTEDVEFDMECLIAEADGSNDLDAEGEYEDDYESSMTPSAWDSRSYQNSSTDLFGQGSSNGNGGGGGANFDSSLPTDVSTPKNGVASRGFVERGSLGIRKKANDTKPSQPVDKTLKSSILHTDYRRPIMIGFGLQLVQQFSGINAVFFYSSMFFAAAQMSDPWLGTVLASTVNVLATGLSIYLIERSGRRPLLLLSTGGMMLSCIGLTYALRVTSLSTAADPPAPWVGIMSVVMVLIFVGFFEIGLGPIPWLIGSEIYPRQVRTQAMGISSTINWLSNFAVGLSFPTLAILLGPYSFVPFGIVLSVALILEYVYVPETQGKTLDEIQEEFLRRASLDDYEDDFGGSRKESNTSAGAPSDAGIASSSTTNSNLRRTNPRSDSMSEESEESADDTDLPPSAAAHTHSHHSRSYSNTLQPNHSPIPESGEEEEQYPQYPTPKQTPKQTPLTHKDAAK